MSGTTRGVIYFDGVCGLCDRFVRFVLHHDRAHVFRFAPLQGEVYRREVARSEGPAPSDSVVVVWEDEDGRREMFVRGQAVLLVLRRLPRFGGVASLLGILPPSWLDRLYDLVATRRYRLFGKMASCRKPIGEEERYFLD